MNELQKQKGRYFFLSFSAAFFILMLTLLFLLLMVPPSPKGQAAEAVDYDIAFGYQPEQEDSLSVLFIGTSQGGQEAESFLLARMDPARDSIPLAPIPGITTVNNQGKNEALWEVYRYGGAEYTRDVLASHLNIVIDRYVRMDEPAFIACANAVGSVEFRLEDEVPVSNGGAQMVLRPGVQLLDGQRAAALLSSKSEEPLEHNMLLGEFAQAVVNQRIDICESALLDKVFSVIINAVDTDISMLDYETRKQAGIYLAGLPEEPATLLQVSGSWEGELYHLSDTFQAALSQAFA